MSSLMAFHLTQCHMRDALSYHLCSTLKTLMVMPRNQEDDTLPPSARLCPPASALHGRRTCNQALEDEPDPASFRGLWALISSRY